MTRPLVDAAEGRRYPQALTEQVVMLHTGRCGSTVLADMLNQHPDIFWAGEIFARMTERHPEVEPGPGALDAVIEKSRRQGRQSGKRIYGFELKYQPHQHLRPEYLDLTVEESVSRLRRLAFSKFIVLHRENYLRQAISVQIGRQQRQWHAKATPSKPTPIELNLEAFRPPPRQMSLLEEFRALEGNYEKLKQLLASDQVLYLSYERDIMDDPRHAYAQCCDFLGVPQDSPQITRARTNPFPYDAMVLNMPAVSALLRNTKYAWMLDA